MCWLPWLTTSPNLLRLSGNGYLRRYRLRTLSSHHSCLWSKQEGCVEAHLPTKQSTPGPQARLPSPHEHAGWPRSAAVAACQGPPPPVGLIWRIRDPRVFARFAHESRRARAGVLWCSFLPDSSDLPPRVAFAIGRAYGPAVSRNLLRRRLRSILAGADLASGWYLFGAKPAAAERSFTDLVADITSLTGQCQRLSVAVTNTSSGPVASSPAVSGKLSSIKAVTGSVTAVGVSGALPPAP